MPDQGMIGSSSNALGVAAGRKILERPDPNVAGSNPRQHSAWERRLTYYAFAGNDGGKRSRGRNSERRHRLADDIFAQNGPERGAPIATARAWRRSRSLALDIAACPVDVVYLSQQDRSPVANL